MSRDENESPTPISSNTRDVLNSREDGCKHAVFSRVNADTVPVPCQSGSSCNLSEDSSRVVLSQYVQVFGLRYQS